jgi:hypothetical protein
MSLKPFLNKGSALSSPLNAPCISLIVGGRFDTALMFEQPQPQPLQLENCCELKPEEQPPLQLDFTSLFPNKFLSGCMFTKEFHTWSWYFLTIQSSVLSILLVSFAEGAERP